MLSCLAGVFLYIRSQLLGRGRIQGRILVLGYQTLPALARAIDGRLSTALHPRLQPGTVAQSRAPELRAAPFDGE
jgi:hypothetical protein